MADALGLGYILGFDLGYTHDPCGYSSERKKKIKIARAAGKGRCLNAIKSGKANDEQWVVVWISKKVTLT